MRGKNPDEPHFEPWSLFTARLTFQPDWFFCYFILFCFFLSQPVLNISVQSDLPISSALIPLSAVTYTSAALCARWSSRPTSSSAASSSTWRATGRCVPCAPSSSPSTVSSSSSRGTSSRTSTATCSTSSRSNERDAKDWALNSWPAVQVTLFLQPVRSTCYYVQSWALFFSFSLGQS